MKIVKNILLTALILLIVALGGFGFWLSDKYVVPIIMFHHVDYGDHHELNTVSPQNFEMQMAYLKNHGYHVMTLDELVKAITEHKRLSHKSVVLTFDDGYRNNYIYAFPILKKYQYPATIFIPSDLMNTTEDFLTWDQIKVMASNGISFQSHTRTHIYLPDYPDFNKVKDEIVGSKAVIEEKLGTRVDYFAYPSGGYSDEIINVLKTAGYKGACTTNRGKNRFNTDVFALKRIRFNNKDRDSSLRFKLSGYYNLFRKLRAPNARSE